MKFVIHYYCLLIVFIFTFSSTYLYAQSEPKANTFHITVNLSDRVSRRFEKYLLYAYNQLGYNVVFEKILSARAREMVSSGRLDAMMIAEKEIVEVYPNLLRIPVMLARGSLTLYCYEQVDCKASALSNVNNTIGVVSGNSMSANYMKEMRASTYPVKGQEKLGSMLIKERLKYVLIVNEERLGNIGNFDDSAYQKVEVHHSEGYHFIHKKYKHLVPELTLALQLSIEKYGTLVNSDKAVEE